MPRWVDRWRHRLRGVRRRALFLGVRALVRRAGFDGLRPLGARLARLHYRIDGRTRRACLAGIAALQGRSTHALEVDGVTVNGSHVATNAFGYGVFRLTRDEPGLLA